MMTRAGVGLIVALVSLIPVSANATCWDGETIAAQVERGTLIVRGRVTQLAAIGCQQGDGTVVPCDETKVKGRAFGSYVERVRIEPWEVLKGTPPEPLEFHVFRPLVDPTGPCRPSMVNVGDVAVAVLRPETGGLLAFGPVYGFVPSQRADYKTWLKRLKREVKKTSGSMR
jgi:hypothetical protein